MNKIIKDKSSGNINGNGDDNKTNMKSNPSFSELAKQIKNL
jgi:hypothetical protein